MYDIIYDVIDDIIKMEQWKVFPLNIPDQRFLRSLMTHSACDICNMHMYVQTYSYTSA